MDKYQTRYLKHQKDKRGLLSLMAKRESLRDFKSGVDCSFYQELIMALDMCPSSCNRKGVEIEWAVERKDKEILSGLLVGGVGWAHRADRIALLWARKEAYKSVNDMPCMYLDAGVILQQAYLFSACSGVKCCFINPNTNKPLSDNGDVFCGALAFGL